MNDGVASLKRLLFMWVYIVMTIGDECFLGLFSIVVIHLLPHSVGLIWSKFLNWTESHVFSVSMSVSISLQTWILRVKYWMINGC